MKFELMRQRGKILSVVTFLFRSFQKSPSLSYSFVGIFIALFFLGLFVGSGSFDPSSAELSFSENSNRDGLVGSIVPASCDSDNPYRNPTATTTDPVSGLVVPIVPGSHFAMDCTTTCPSGIGTYDPYTDPGATGCPSSLYLICPASATVVAGGTQQFRAYYRAGGLSCSNLAGATDVTSLVTWTSSNPSIGTVGNAATAGLATAVTTTGGTTGITVSQYLGNSAPGATFTVQSSSTALRICPTVVTLVNSTVYQMRAFYLLGGVNCAAIGPAVDVTNLVTWTSSAPLIATVGNGATAGRITTLATGATNITISSYLGQTAPRATVIVTGGYAICPISASTYSGGTTQLRAYYSLTGPVNCSNLTGTTDVTGSVTWFSSTTSVGTVAGGLVTGVSGGSTSITVSPHNGASAVPVTVTIGGGYKICPASAIVGSIGFSFHAYYNPSGAVNCGNLAGTSDVTGSVTWSSSNPGVATVGNGGTAGVTTPVGIGSSNISTTPYTGIPSGNAVANVICIPSVTCASAGPSATAANTCPSETFTIDDGCGFPVVCSGTRTCDFNWKEVSQ